jgi:CTP:molybdopterin cytidylyltransferase MocA
MIVIPMAGASKRFSEAGYDRPKYELLLTGRSVFDHAASSFDAYFQSDPFLFVVGPQSGAAAFVDAACRRLGIADFQIAALDAPTAGQAETVALGLERIGAGELAPVTIFNIDTFRPRFRFPPRDWPGWSDGWLEVFRGAGANWS